MISLLGMVMTYPLRQIPGLLANMKQLDIQKTGAALRLEGVDAAHVSRPISAVYQTRVAVASVAPEIMAYDNSIGNILLHYVLFSAFIDNGYFHDHYVVTPEVPVVDSADFGVADSLDASGIAAIAGIDGDAVLVEHVSGIEDA